MVSNDIYAAGYAVPLYGISHDVQHWRYWDEEFVTPMSVRRVEFIGFAVARIEDVRASAVV